VSGLKNIKIDGIKLSEELLQVNVTGVPDPQKALAGISRMFAENRINMALVTAACPGSGGHAACCVPVEEHGRVTDLIERDADLKKYVSIVSPVGLLSLFPHRSSLKLLGSALQAFGNAGIPVYGLASSLAPLTFVVDHHRLDAAIGALGEVFEIPPGIIMRPVIRVVQSSLTKGEDEAR